jgi:hypothetical protein
MRYGVSLAFYVMDYVMAYVIKGGKRESEKAKRWNVFQ